MYRPELESVYLFDAVKASCYIPWMPSLSPWLLVNGKYRCVDGGFSNLRCVPEGEEYAPVLICEHSDEFPSSHIWMGPSLRATYPLLSDIVGLLRTPIPLLRECDITAEIVAGYIQARRRTMQAKAEWRARKRGGKVVKARSNGLH